MGSVKNWGLFAKVNCGATSPTTTSFGEEAGASTVHVHKKKRASFMFGHKLTMVVVYLLREEAATQHKRLLPNPSTKAPFQCFQSRLG